MSGRGGRYGPGQVEPPNAVQPPVRPDEQGPSLLDAEIVQRAPWGSMAWTWRLFGRSHIRGVTADLPMTQAEGYAWTARQAERRAHKAASRIRARAAREQATRRRTQI